MAEDTTMRTSEGTVEERETYLHHVYPTIECTFKLWYGTRRKGQYQSVAPVHYHNMTRDQAYTALVYDLNTGNPRVNPNRQGYSDLHTRGIEE